MFWTDFRQRLRGSILYDAYWNVVRQDIIRERDREVRSYRAILGSIPENATFFDVGANHGFKADIFLRVGACRVIAVDPDPYNQRLLSARFHMFRLHRRPVEIVPKAVSDSAKTAYLWVDKPGSAKNTLSTKWVSALREDEARFGESIAFGEKRLVETTRMADLVAQYGRPFFVKIDVEGHEPAVVAGMTEPVPYLSFEVNLPEFRGEGAACLEMLHSLDPNCRFNYSARLGSGCAEERWMPYNEFCALFATVAEPSIEVFCRSNL